MDLFFRFIFGPVIGRPARYGGGIANSSRSPDFSLRSLYTVFRKSLLVCGSVATVLVLTACGPSQADYQKALDENERLRAEIAKLTSTSAGALDHPAADAASPSLNLNIDDLWAQRFDDNEFRSRQRLADKLIRVSGLIEGISEDSITLVGTDGHFSEIQLRVILRDDYAEQMKTLQSGSVITVQGIFVFDRKWLKDAVMVDAKTGAIISGPGAIKATGSAPD